MMDVPEDIRVRLTEQCLAIFERVARTGSGMDAMEAALRFERERCAVENERLLSDIQDATDEWTLGTDLWVRIAAAIRRGTP